LLAEGSEGRSCPVKSEDLFSYRDIRNIKFGGSCSCYAGFNLNLEVKILRLNKNLYLEFVIVEFRAAFRATQYISQYVCLAGAIFDFEIELREEFSLAGLTSAQLLYSHEVL
jgi:hypothetical protein